MNSKTLLKFYFGAEGLNKLLDGMILRAACASAFAPAQSSAERVAALVGAKAELASLWEHIDGVLKGFCREDVAVLKRYCRMKRGYAVLPDPERNLVRRVAVRFRRRLGGALFKSAGADILKRYVVLLGGR